MRSYKLADRQIMRATFTHLIGPQKGELAKFDAERITIGRAQNNMLCLGDTARRVSSHHAEVTHRGDQFFLRDLGSTNGTTVNGRRVVVSELAHDDLIEFGAGGPLVRFGIEHPEKEDQIETVAKDLRRQDRIDSQAAVRDRSTGPGGTGSRNNAALIAALAAAMLLGGVGGIVASSRLRAPDPESMSYAEIADMNIPSVVLIRTEFDLLDAAGQTTTSEARVGTGFIINQSGLIVTNRHVILDWEYNPPTPGITGRITKIEAILPGHTFEDAASAELYKLGPDKSVDVAILKIGAPSERFARVEPEIARTNPGDEVVVIGYPLGLDLLQWTKDTTAGPSLSTGIVSRVGHDFIQLNLRAYHGNSGGPVINRKGEVIGILTANYSAAHDIALCTPISAALALVNSEMQTRGNLHGRPSARAALLAKPQREVLAEAGF